MNAFWSHYLRKIDFVFVTFAYQPAILTPKKCWDLLNHGFACGSYVTSSISRSFGTVSLLAYARIGPNFSEPLANIALLYSSSTQSWVGCPITTFAHFRRFSCWRLTVWYHRACSCLSGWRWIFPWSPFTKCACSSISYHVSWFSQGHCRSCTAPIDIQWEDHRGNFRFNEFPARTIRTSCSWPEPTCAPQRGRLIQNLVLLKPCHSFFWLKIC